MSEYLYLVRMDVPPEHEADFNKICDTQHIPEISNVPGVPEYAALYRVASPAVPRSPAWAAASDTGEWKPRIRPHAFNRIHALFKAPT